MLGAAVTYVLALVTLASLTELSAMLEHRAVLKLGSTQP